MSDARKAIMTLRQDAVARGMTDLAIAYGISYIRLSQDFVDVMVAYQKLKQEWDKGHERRGLHP